MTPIEFWFSILLTLACLSLMYKENPAYSAAEHIYIGLCAGHFFVLAFNNIKNMGVTPLTKGNMLVLIPIILGVMLYSRFDPKIRWIARYPLSFLTGLGVAMTIRGSIPAQLVPQVRAAMVPLNSLDNVIMSVSTLAVLIFFLFTRSSLVPVSGQISKFGRWIMMVAFGASFGGAVMGAMTLLSGRVRFLLQVFMK